MIVIFNQVVVLFTFIVIGYVLGKKVLKTTDGSSILSTILVYVFLPCNIIKTFSSQFSIYQLKKNISILIVSTILLLSIILISHLSAKLFSKDYYKQNVFEYILVVPNYGYMGYAVAEALFGEAELLNTMIFAIPIMLYTYTRGYSILTKKAFNLKMLANPITLSVLFGIVIGLLNISLPETLISLITKSSMCMAPTSMLLTGITISSFCLKELFCDTRIYIVSILRLVVIPISIFAVLYLFNLKSSFLPAVVLYSMPCGLNTVIFPQLIGEDCKTGAAAAVISNSLALLTIPLCIRSMIL